MSEGYEIDIPVVDDDDAMLIDEGILKYFFCLVLSRISLVETI
jgi:hypothetical protein